MGYKKKDALVVATVYAIFATIWIVFSDWFFFTINESLEEFVYFSIIKGLLFVWGSAAIIFISISAQIRYRHSQEQTTQKLRDTQSEYLTLYENKKAMFYSAIKSAPIPMILHTENKRIKLVSDVFETITGYTAKEIPTMRAWVEKAYPMNTDEYYRKIMALYDLEGTLDEGPTKLQTKSGEAVHFHWYTSYIGYDEDGLKVILSSAINITEQKTKEKELTHDSYHDDLTGLFNRRYYNEIIKRYDKHHNMGIVLADINGLKLVNDVFGHTHGDELLIKFSNCLKDHFPKTATIARIGGDEFVILLEDYKTNQIKEIAQSIKKNIRHNGKEDIIPSAAFGYTRKLDNESFKTAFIRAENMLYKDKIHEYNKQTASIIESLKYTLLQNTDESEVHIERLKKIAQPLISVLDLNSQEQRELRLLIELHDIGKISIDYSIYENAAKLTDEEKKEIERHSEIGYRIANALPKLKNVAYAILTHHENVDGSGYPFGLNEEEIPLISKIFRVIDSFETMTRERNYQAAMNKQKALEEIKRLSDIYYCPHVVQALERVFPELEV